MKHRQYFKDIIRNGSYKGKKSCEDLNLVLTVLKRNERFIKSYLELDLYDGIKWVEGYSNFINKSLLKESTNNDEKRYNKGDIITVDFFGHYGEEMAYDHPAIVLKNFRNGLIVAPITSNQNLYKNPKEFHILLPANDAKRGKMLKNSTIKLEQWIYVNILDTKKLSPFQNNIHSWSVLYPAKPVK